MPTETPHNDDRDAQPGVHITTGPIDAQGDVNIAGRDNVNVGATRGSAHETMTLTIGGVPGSQTELKELSTRLDTLDAQIKAAPLDPESREAAQHNAQQVRQQLTSEKKPNGHIVVQAAEALFDYGPDIAGAVLAAFTTPLAGRILSAAGSRALAFYRKLRGQNDDAPPER